MFHVALYQPEIPPNTGNIVRLCANTGAQLHLIHPLGFATDDRQVKRAGLDYHIWAEVQHHNNYQQFLEKLQPKRLFACSTKGISTYDKIDYRPDDVFLFGPETRGLPASILDSLSSNCVIRVPMLPVSRSLNLSNAVAIILYEAWRQQYFHGASIVYNNR
jgi:tRNA (cytidine/uridine-2'-O-)-methyltransferase